MTNNEESVGVKERIKGRLLEATSEDELKRIRQELKDQGEKPGSIDACVSELRKQGHLKFNGKTLAITKALPVEAIVENLPWPVDVDGHVDGAFVAGMRYEAMNVIRGIRLAQELTKLGIDQATPLIKMAQEMRQTEGQVAKETGIAMGSEIAGRMFDFMEQRLPQKSDIAMAPKPFEGVMARTMETMMNRLLGITGGGQPGPTPGLVDKRTQK
jgi:hypothetical protein